MNNKIIKIIKLLLLIVSLISLVVFVFPRETFKDFGEIAWNLLIVVMFIRPIRDLFPKCKIFKFILKFRRELEILVGVFGIAHTIGAFIEYMQAINHTKTYIDLFFDKYVWDYSKFMFYGMLAFLVSIPLLITSNGLSTSMLGKHWKTLQRLSYFMFIMVALHMYMIKSDFAPIIIIFIWILLYIIAYIKNKKVKTIGNGKKWLCIPCGYIYDESIGDIDSGISPGTKFEDIPEDWICPVCGVSKKDFILYDEKEKVETTKCEVISFNMLTKNILELIIKSEKEFNSISGQYVNFLFRDDLGDFRRSYSIVEQDGNNFKFCIKLGEESRSAKILKNLKLGNNLEIIGIFGDFVLKNTKNPKVFVATGTGLAPILNMLKSNGGLNCTLHFCVAKKEDLFYIEEIKNISNLDYKIYLTRDESEGCINGRIDLTKFNFSENTEFYICGNKEMVENYSNYLKNKGYNSIYYEKF